MDMLDIYLYVELSLLLFNGTEDPWAEQYISSATPTKQKGLRFLRSHRTHSDI